MLGGKFMTFLLILFHHVQKNLWEMGMKQHHLSFKDLLGDPCQIN